MAATSRFSRRLRRFSGPDLKVRRKVRQLEITRDKRTRFALVSSLVALPPPPLTSLNRPCWATTLLRRLNAAERGRLYI